MERIRSYGLGMTRADATKMLGEMGYTFQGPTGSSQEPKRPHAVGRSADGKHSIELIGPEERIFKAVLLADLSVDVQDVAARFLSYFVPDWSDASLWLSSNLPQLSQHESAETRMPHLQVHLRRTGNQHKAALTLSWIPD